MQIINGNYIDLVVILIFIYFILGSFRHNFWLVLVDFISFLSSLILSFKFYKPISEFLKTNFSLTLSLSNALGFLFSAIIVESILAVVFGFIVSKLPKKVLKNKFIKYLNILPSIGEALILVAFLLTLFVSLPIKPQIKVDITKSKIGFSILEKTSKVESSINDIFGGVINDTLTYFTVKPDSNTSVSLEVEQFNLNVDEKAESEIFQKINEERIKLGILELAWNPDAVPIARNHASDMWNRKYFSHYSPEGDNVGDRLNKDNIQYSYAGENLALAPTVATAHTGLMNSQGHRENILNKDFNKVGIGVVDNGYYGKMFVQIFTD